MLDDDGLTPFWLAKTAPHGAVFGRADTPGESRLIARSYSGALKAMSESSAQKVAERKSHDDVDAIALSAFLSSKVCHDLINPVGAVSSGLEVLDDAEMDQTMQDAAMDLIRTGASKAIALLTYARLAYGAAGGFGAQINLDDAKKAMEGVFASAKADLEWRIGEGYGPKENVKTLLILGHAASESVPRGGVVRIEGDIANFRIEATGKKVLLQDDFVRALGGDSSDLTPKFSPAFIVSKLAKEAGARVRARLDGEMAIFEANFPE